MRRRTCRPTPPPVRVRAARRSTPYADPHSHSLPHTRRHRAPPTTPRAGGELAQAADSSRHRLPSETASTPSASAETRVGWRRREIMLAIMELCSVFARMIAAAFGAPALPGFLSKAMNSLRMARALHGRRGAGVKRTRHRSAAPTPQWRARYWQSQRSVLRSQAVLRMVAPESEGFVVTPD